MPFIFQVKGRQHERKAKASRNVVYTSTWAIVQLGLLALRANLIVQDCPEVPASKESGYGRFHSYVWPEGLSEYSAVSF